MSNPFIERKIIIALITSDEFIHQIRPIFNSRLLGSSMAKRLSGWCIEYYDKYKQAPKVNIEGIYYDKLRRGLPKDLAEEIEQDILPDLSEEYSQNNEDVEVLIQQARQYLAEKNLELHLSKIKDLLESGDFEEANKLALQFKPLSLSKDTSIRFDSESIMDAIDAAFSEANHPLIRYPKALGEFWNHHFIQGGFVALMAPEKRGKTFMLMDMARRAVRQGNTVVFFQAGDMTQSQQIRRFAIHLAKTSDKEQYCGTMFEPVADCMYNQLNTCNKKIRECDFGVLEDQTEKDIRDVPTYEMLKEAYLNNPDYQPCHNCLDYYCHSWGVPWLRRIEVKGPLEKNTAKRLFEQHFMHSRGRLILSSHANGTLSISEMKGLLDEWYKADGIIPHIIIIDYADLLVPSTKQEFRHQQNEIWKNLRLLSQEKRGGIDPLVITATQADADSYDRNLLQLKNFSEDKRKYGHVTALFGLNQDPKGREKELGILRINEIVVREGESNPNRVVHVLQNLKRGLPYITSYF
jgi:hypothetical protein